MADARARSPLADRVADLTTIGAEQVPFLAQVDLRVDPEHADLAPYALPLEPDTAWHDEHHAALWLGPDEWLILGPADTAHEIVTALEAAFADVQRSVVDVLGRAQVILHERTETTGILVRPSFADYLVDLLLAVRGATGGVGA
ncbi:MAG: hypothetical protein E6G43_09675 [Actinobacteria bacterium]|nr:MAG: hypothetical protein E6G43_09675 [Actinomycetota bacterium]